MHVLSAGQKLARWQHSPGRRPTGPRLQWGYAHGIGGWEGPWPGLQCQDPTLLISDALPLVFPVCFEPHPGPGSPSG